MKTTHLFSAVLVAATTYAHTSEQWGIFAKVGDRFKPLVIPDLGGSDFEPLKYSDSNQKPTSLSVQDGIAKRPGGYVGIVGDYLAYGPDLSPKPFSLGPDNKIVKLDFHRCPNSGDAIVVKEIPDCIPVDLYLNKLEGTTNGAPDNELTSPSTVRYVPAPDVPHTLFVKEREYFRLLHVSFEGGALVWGVSTLQPVRMHYQNDNLFTEATDGTRSFVFIDKGTLGLSDSGPRLGVSIDVHGKIRNVDGKARNVQLYSCPSAYPLYTISAEDGNGCFPSEVYYSPYDKSGNPTLPGNALPEAEVYKPDVEENPMAFFAKEKDSYHPLSSYKGSGRSIQLSYGLPLPPIEIEWQGSYARPRNTLISGFAGFLDNRLVFSSFKDEQFSRSRFENGGVLKVFSCNLDTSGIFYILRESDPSSRCLQVELCVGRFDRRTGKYISLSGAPGQDDDDSEQEEVKPAEEGKSEGANDKPEEKATRAGDIPTQKKNETSIPDETNGIPELGVDSNPSEGALGHSDVERDTPKGETSGGSEGGKGPVEVAHGGSNKEVTDESGSNSGSSTNPNDEEPPALPAVDGAKPEETPISPKIDDKEPKAEDQDSNDRKTTKGLDQKPDVRIKSSNDTAWHGEPDSVGETNEQTDAEETEEADSSDRTEEKDHKQEESESGGPTNEEETRDSQPDKDQGAADGGEPETKHRPAEQKPTGADHPKKGPVTNDGHQMESESNSVNDIKGHESAKGDGPGVPDTKEKDRPAKGEERSRKGDSKGSKKESSNAEGSKKKDPNDEGTNEEGSMVEGLNEEDSSEETNGKESKHEDSNEESSEASSKDSSEDSSKDSSEDSSKDSSKESSKDSKKDSKEDSKEDWNENSNADSNETGQDARDSTEQNSKKVSYEESKTKDIDAEESKENESMGDDLDAEDSRAIDSKSAAKKDSKKDPNEKGFTEEGSKEEHPNKASNESNNDPKDEATIGEDMQEISNGLDSSEEVSEAKDEDPRDPHRNAPGAKKGREVKPFEKGRGRNTTLVPSHIFTESSGDSGSISITSRYNSTNHSIPEASRSSEQARHFFSHTNMSSSLELNRILVFGTSATSLHKAPQPKHSSCDTEIVSGNFAECQAINSAKTENTTAQCTPKAITAAAFGAKFKPGERFRKTPHTDDICYCTQPTSTTILKCDKKSPSSTVIVTAPTTRILSGVRQVLGTDMLRETPSRHETAKTAPQGAMENGEARVFINGSTSGILDTSECGPNDEPLKDDKPGEGLSRPSGDSKKCNDHSEKPSNETERPSAETNRTSNGFDEQKAGLDVERKGSIEPKNGSKGPSNEPGKQSNRPNIAIENSERYGIGSIKKVIGDNENDITKQSEYPAGPKPATDPTSHQALPSRPMPSNRENPSLSTPFKSVSDLEVTPSVNGAFRNTYSVWFLGLAVMFG